MAGWTLLTNHGHALLCVAKDPGMTLRQIGDCVGITERAAHRIVSDLVEAGYLEKRREGTRNAYEVKPDVPMRHPLIEDHWVGELLAVLVADRDVFSGSSSRSSS
jgi:DNA-binding transcriptional ArsR family regulator